jgi:hypothetical protein
MALPIIRELSLQIAPRLDAASLSSSDVECMRDAIRASEVGNDAQTRARVARLDALDVKNGDDQNYIRTRFAYEVAYKRPSGASGDRLDALTDSERALLAPSSQASSRADAQVDRFDGDVDRYRFLPGDR